MVEEIGGKSIFESRKHILRDSLISKGFRFVRKGTTLHKSSRSLIGSIFKKRITEDIIQRDDVIIAITDSDLNEYANKYQIRIGDSVSKWLDGENFDIINIEKVRREIAIKKLIN